VRGYLNVDMHVMLDVERIGTCCRISTSSQQFKINISDSKVSNLTCKTFVGSIILITVLKNLLCLHFIVILSYLTKHVTLDGYGLSLPYI
jgi:hypothetical protein